MPEIHVLRKEVSELIAAGEVIERPASVVKELVENAIDAGASHITVEIKRGGTTYMRIVDDGCGMAAEDVSTAFLRHATSKITEKSDLTQIHTLGFRGEALASVAAVSKVTVLTKRKQDAYGTSFSIAASVPGEVLQSGCPDGTTILIRDLFYNVPVRQKFMKRDTTEANAVSMIVQKIALSHPQIAFQMIRDNRMEFRTDGTGDLFSAIYAVCGKEFAHDMVPVSYDDGAVRVSGFAGKPLYAKSNRTFQNFFVNGRYVRSRVQILSAFYIHIFFCLIAVGVAVGLKVWPTVYIIQLLYYMVANIILLFALSLITSSIVVFFRDLNQIISVILLIGMWGTPIAWTLAGFPEAIHKYFKLNPFFYIIEGYRDAILGRQWFWEHPHLTLYFWVFVIILLVIGGRIYVKLRPHFADTV